MTHLTYLGDRDFIRNLTDIVLTNLGKENFGVNELVHAAGTSHSTISRKLHRITGKTLNQFIKEKRLQRAMEMLHDQSAHISEIAHRTGFGSTAYFDKCFHEYYGYPPGEVKKRYPVSDAGNNPEGSLIDKMPDLNLMQEKILASQVQRPGIWISSFAGMTILMMALVYVLFNYFFLQHPDIKFFNKISRNSVTVLPFKSLTSNIDIQNLADQLTEEIIVQLTEFPDLKILHGGSLLDDYVVSQSTLENDINSGAQYALEGSIRGDIDNLRVSALLIDLRNQRIIMSVRYDTKADSLSQVRDRIVRKVVSELKASLVAN